IDARGALNLAAILQRGQVRRHHGIISEPFVIGRPIIESPLRRGDETGLRNLPLNFSGPRGDAAKSSRSPRRIDIHTPSQLLLHAMLSEKDEPVGSRGLIRHLSGLKYLP